MLLTPTGRESDRLELVPHQGPYTMHSKGNKGDSFFALRDVDGHAGARRRSGDPLGFFKSGENGGGKRTGGREMELGFSQTSPREGICSGQAGSCLARPRRSPATWVPAWPELKTHVPLWAGLGQAGG